MTMTQTVAGNIRAEAARAGKNQTDIAKAIGIAQANVSTRWRGRVAWSLNEIEQVADLLGLDPLDLLRARRDSNPQPSDP